MCTACEAMFCSKAGPLSCDEVPFVMVRLRQRLNRPVRVFVRACSRCHPCKTRPRFQERQRYNICDQGLRCATACARRPVAGAAGKQVALAASPNGDHCGACTKWGGGPACSRLGKCLEHSASRMCKAWCCDATLVPRWSCAGYTQVLSVFVLGGRWGSDC